jgi:sulfur carrier protein
LEVNVNNEILSIPNDYTISMLLQHIQFSKSVAIFINGRQLLMREYEHYPLNEGDKIKIIRLLGGG